MTELALRLIAENKKTKAKYLDLGNCGLKALPAALRECIWLEELVLSNVWQEYEAEEGESTDRKSINTGSENELVSIEGIENLSNLRKLTLSQRSNNGGNALSDLSPLSTMSSLVYLDFRNTKVYDLSFAKQLTNLKYLFFSSTSVTDLSPLSRLRNITILHLRDTLVDNLAPLSKLTQLTILGCSNTKISNLEPLKKLSNLEKIQFSSTSVADLTPLGGLRKLESLFCSGTLIRSLSPLSKNKGLKELFFQNTDVGDLSPISALTALQRLGFSSTRIVDLSALESIFFLEELSFSNTNVNSLRPLRNLKNLSKLNFSRTKVKDLEPLNVLSKLVQLNCSKTDVIDLSSIAFLSGLSILNCSQTKIASLNPLTALTKLTKIDCSRSLVNSLEPIKESFTLSELSCSRTLVKDLSPISNLRALKELNCSITNISDLSPLGKLKELSILNCYRTRVSDIAPLEELRKLKYLNLSLTEVSSLVSLKKAENLTKLLLHNSKVSDLRPISHLIRNKRKVAWSQYRGDITVQNCPLIHPPIEIVKQENEAILNYFEELDRAKAQDEIVRLAEAKCLILGEGGAGKTSLARKLINRDNTLPNEEETTKGIQVFPLDMQLADGTDFRLNIWDFGGQEIYHATHQFFLTKRSLYLLVDDTRKDEKTVNDPLFNYWLQVAQLYGGNSPLLIIQNEKGDRSKQLDLGGMQHRFGFVKDSKATNLLHNRGLEEVWAAIRYWLRQLPHISEEQPKSWVDIRRELERLVLEENRDHITLQEYLNICQHYGIEERKRALFLSRYLHDFGAFLHFQDHPLLRKTLVLKNQWATDAVYKVLDCEAIKKQFGRFSEVDLKTIWDNDSYIDQHPELLALMEKFELCYQLPNEKKSTWLAPQLLSVIPPAELNWDKSDNLQIRYEYEFMPRGLLSQHIVRMHRYLLQPDLAWKSGVVFEREAAKALVTEEWGLRKINLSATGRQAKELLTLLSEDFDTMHERLEGLRVKKMIPCNCSECRTVPEPHFYDYKNLNKRRQVGKLTVECQLSYEDVNVQHLLSGIFIENISTEETRKVSFYESGKTRVFISYAKEDITHREELLKQLRALDSDVSIWYDGLIPAGANVEESIKGALLEADVVLLLVSANSIADNHIKETELPVIQARETAGECILVPIIVNYCIWEQLDFAKHNSLPNKSIPITAPSWQNEAQAWSEVVNGIKKLI